MGVSVSVALVGIAVVIIVVDAVGRLTLNMSTMREVWVVWTGRKVEESGRHRSIVRHVIGQGVASRVGCLRRKSMG